MFLQLGIEQPYDDTSRIQPKEWQVLLSSATTWLSVAGKTIYSCCLLEEFEKWQVQSRKTLEARVLGALEGSTAESC